MKLIHAFAICIVLSTSSSVLASSEIQQVPLHLEPGAPTMTITSKIKGVQTVDYQLRGLAGQSLKVEFKPSNPSAYFNLLPQDSESAIFIGSTLGNRFEGWLPTDGQYSIRVYLMRSAARRNETSTYTLKLALKDGPVSTTPKVVGSLSPPKDFDQTLELQGIHFHVTSRRNDSNNTLRIVPSGLTIDNSPIERTIDETIAGAEIADLNADGSPEIYIYLTSPGSGTYGSLVAYSANRRKSLSEIHLPPLSETIGATNGYLGHDQFAVLEGVLGRRFPIYREPDINANPTGGMRQLQYKLVQGEAGWMLKVDRVIEF